MSEQEWTLERLDQHVKGKIQEHLYLEYKACADLLGNVDIHELSKDVSAFANADGGTLIFGIKEGQGRDKKHLPESLDEGFTRGGKVSAIWLEDILLSNISPKIQGLKPYEIELENGNFLLVLEVPSSQYGPHMAKDHKYYKRRQTKAEPMEHYEVEDVRNRSRGALLKLNVDFHRTEEVPGGIKRIFFSPGTQLPLDIRIENLVEKPAEYAAVTFYLDSHLQVRSSDVVHGSEFHKSGEIYSKDLGLELEHGGCLFIRYYAPVGLPKASPVWKGNPVPLIGVHFQIPTLDRWSENFYFGWEISAPHMQTQRQFCVVNFRREAPDKVSIMEWVKV